MYKVLICILTLAACGGSVRMKKDSNLGEQPPWCFRADYKGQGDQKMTYSWNCFKSQSLCNGALKVSKKYGGLASVTALTICKKI